jgi:CubicO group peptidase (beta-lactamase class C family)
MAPRHRPERFAAKTAAGRAAASRHGIDGWVAPGFGGIADAFIANFDAGLEIGAAFSVVREGELVVDLWGGMADRSRSVPWGEDTLQLIFSGTKGLVATCILICVERGLLDLEAPVARYWPEYGKGHVRVRDVVSHTARLPGVDEETSVDNLLDTVAMAARLARQQPSDDPRAELCYHALTYGWLCGELVRRVTGMSIGRFFAAEIAGPLELEIWIGLPEVQSHRVSTLEMAPDWGVGMPFLQADALEHDRLIRSIWGNPPVLTGPSHLWNTQRFRAAEIPGANAIGAARSIARLYDRLACGGAPILTSHTIALGTSTLSDGLDAVHGARRRSGVGFQLQTERLHLGPPLNAFGHDGAGGGHHGAWPDQRVGFSYAMNLMRDDGGQDPRAANLLRALHRAVS